MESVSVIITTRNRLDLLKRAIDSVMAQTYQSIECIVVDDASSDGTEEYCLALPLKYIRISEQPHKGGANYGRNIGIRAATGRWIAFLDDDDYWLPEKIEKQVDLILAKKCGLVYCGYRKEIVGREGTSFRDCLPTAKWQGDLSRKILTTINCCTTSLVLAEKQLLSDIGMFDENILFWQDYELTIRAAQATPFYFVDEILCIYRVDQQDRQRVTNKYSGWNNTVRYIYGKHRALYQKLSLTEKIKRKKIWVRDAVKRCKKERLMERYYQLRGYFLLLSVLLPLTQIPYFLIRWLTNPNRKATAKNI